MKIIKKVLVVVALVMISILSYSQDKTIHELKLKCSVEKAFNLAFKEATIQGWEIINITPSMYIFSAKTPQIGIKYCWDNVNVLVDGNDTISIITIKSQKAYSYKYLKIYLDILSNKIKN